MTSACAHINIAGDARKYAVIYTDDSDRIQGIKTIAKSFNLLINMYHGPMGKDVNIKRACNSFKMY